MADDQRPAIGITLPASGASCSSARREATHRFQPPRNARSAAASVACAQRCHPRTVWGEAKKNPGASGGLTAGCPATPVGSPPMRVGLGAVLAAPPPDTARRWPMAPGTVEQS
jgi:hypothetical protein